MPTTLETLRELVASKYAGAKDNIVPEATMESLGLDSLDLVELLFDVEDKFDIRIPQDGGSAIRTATVGELVEIIDHAIAEKAAEAPTVGVE